MATRKRAQAHSRLERDALGRFVSAHKSHRTKKSASSASRNRKTAGSRSTANRSRSVSWW